MEVLTIVPHIFKSLPTPTKQIQLSPRIPERNRIQKSEEESTVINLK